MWTRRLLQLLPALVLAPFGGLFFAGVHFWEALRADLSPRSRAKEFLLTPLAFVIGISTTGYTVMTA